MVDQILAAMKNAAIAYRSITPASQLYLRGIASTLMGLFCILLPDILLYFGIHIQDWKNALLVAYGTVFVGIGFSFGFLPQVFPIQQAYEFLTRKGFFATVPNEDSQKSAHQPQEKQ